MTNVELQIYIEHDKITGNRRRWVEHGKMKEQKREGIVAHNFVFNTRTEEENVQIITLYRSDVYGVKAYSVH